MCARIGNIYDKYLKKQVVSFLFLQTQRITLRRNLVRIFNLKDGYYDEAGVQQHDGVGHQPVQFRQRQLGVNQSAIN